MIHKPLELISEKWKYRNIGKEAVTNIRVQRNIQLNDRTLDMRDRYNEDVRLYSKRGKTILQHKMKWTYKNISEELKIFIKMLLTYL